MGHKRIPADLEIKCHGCGYVKPKDGFDYRAVCYRHKRRPYCLDCKERRRNHLNVCDGCLTWLPPERFGQWRLNRKNKDGLLCLDCKPKHLGGNPNRESGRRVGVVTELPCARCKEVLPAGLFSERSTRPGILQSWCKVCNGEHASQHAKKYEGSKDSASRRTSWDELLQEYRFARDFLALTETQARAHVQRAYRMTDGAISAWYHKQKEAGKI